MTDRATLLKKILHFKKPDELHALQSELAELGEDSDECLAYLDRGMVIAVLERFLRSELTQANIEDWANAIEMHEDIQLGQDDEEEDVFDAISQLANPPANHPLSQQSAQALLKRLISPNLKKN